MKAIMGVGAVGNRVLWRFSKSLVDAFSASTRDGSVHALRRHASLEGGRTDLAERRVAPPLVIEHFDVVEQLHLGLAVAVEVLAEFALDRREEAFHHGIDGPPWSSWRRR